MLPARASIVYWSLAISGTIAILSTRFGVAYRSETPLGIGLGVLAAMLIILSVFVGQKQGRQPAPQTRGAIIARQLHIPVGLLTVSAAIAHWQVLWKNLLGLTGMVLLLVVVFSVILHHARHSSLMLLLHQYAAYALAAVSIAHGIDTLFLATNQ